MSKNNIIQAFINVDPDKVKARIDKEATPPTATLIIPSEDGNVEITLAEFDDMYRGFVRLWPVIKPAKTELVGLVREHEATTKREAKEKAEAEKKANRAKEKAERDAKREADKQAKEEAKAQKAKEREEAAAKKQKEKEAAAKAKEKAAKDKAKAEAKAKAAKK